MIRNKSYFFQKFVDYLCLFQMLLLMHLHYIFGLLCQVILKTLFRLHISFITMSSIQ